jgi:hypothetical protein
MNFMHASYVFKVLMDNEIVRQFIEIISSSHLLSLSLLCYSCFSNELLSLIISLDKSKVLLDSNP